MAISARAMWLILIGVLFGSLLVPSAEVRGQQTIFNVPTTDVLDKGKVYVELDVPFKPNRRSR